MRFSLALFFVGLLTPAFAQFPLAIHGSTTVHGALAPKQAELEALIGRKIEFNGVPSPLGLTSLAAGRADIAMISSPLAEVAGKVNEKTPGSIEVSQYRTTQIGRVKIVFVVNPRNPVRALSSIQLADVLTGRIKNWQAVGGNQGAIVVVSLANAGSLIETNLLGGMPITSAARLVSNATQIPAVVAQDVNGIGIISTAHVKGPTSLVQTDVEIFVPLILVTKGEPKSTEKALIEAAQKLLGGMK